MNTVIANIVIIAFISSIGAFIMKLIQGYVPFENALFLIIQEKNLYIRIKNDMFFLIKKIKDEVLK